MYLTKLLIRDFGKYHNEEFSLTPGVNVIEEKEEKGRSAIAGFISGLFFGIRKDSAMDAEEYARFRPEGQNRYSGMGYVKKDDKSYLIDRTFLAGMKRTSVLEVQSGREVNLKVQDNLAGTLTDTDKNTYRDTRVILQPEKNAADELETFLGNRIDTGSAVLDKQKAIAFLEQEKAKHDPRPMIRRLESLNDEIETYDYVDEALEKNKLALQELTEEFAIEAEKRKRVARQIVENEDGTVSYKSDEELDEKLERIREKENAFGATREKDDENEPKKKITDNFFVILLTGLFVIGVVAGIVYLIPFEDTVRKLFIIFTAIFVVITILTGFKDKGYFDDGENVTPTEEDFNRVLTELEEEKDSREEDEFDITFAKEYSEKKDQLKEEEKDLLMKKNIRERLKAEQSQVFRKKAELDDEVKAINLAISSIEKLSGKFRQQAAETFVPYLSEYIAAMTDNAYAALLFDGEKGLSVDGYQGKKAIRELPEEMVKKIYLAIRLSMAKHTSGDRLPLIIDDMGILTSEAEAEAFLSVLEDTNQEQIVLLSENEYLRRVLQRRDNAFNCVRLG